MGNQVIDQSCLCDGALIKALDIEGQVSFPVGNAPCKSPHNSAGEVET